MKWYEITVYTTDLGTEAVCDALSEAGFEGFTIEESREKAASFLNESALYWDFADYDKIGAEHPCVKTYVEAVRENEPRLAAARDAVERMKRQTFPFDVGPLELSVTLRDDEDWANSWKKNYKPMKIGDRLLVLPSWETADAEGRVVLKLDPGMAFGTGSHQTTHMCLELIEKTVRKGDAALDLGCGSGILSIAAVLLGSSSAKAVDIDPVAEHIAVENAALNGIGADRYSVYVGDVLTDKTLQKRIEGRYEVVVANIVADVIIRLAPLASGLVKPGGSFIVSGIITERLQEVRDALINAGFTITEEKRMDDWNAVLCVLP
ncbi:MAG: 50S ribosomal protein L11 methyltransferase [Clostridia bacterium]|nr:50S ribosomal protein L11 methyltransferase [Clostridia bacterium]